MPWEDGITASRSRWRVRSASERCRSCEAAGDEQQQHTLRTWWARAAAAAELEGAVLAANMQPRQGEDLKV